MALPLDLYEKSFRSNFNKHPENRIQNKGKHLANMLTIAFIFNMSNPSFGIFYTVSCIQRQVYSRVYCVHVSLVAYLG